MMKIAVATEDGLVAQHFGRCPYYTLFEVTGGRVKGESRIESPGHQPGYLPGYLAELGIDCIIASGMGPRAQNLFEAQGISTVVGASGPARNVAEAYAEGRLQAGPSTCTHQEGPHQGCQQ